MSSVHEELIDLSPILPHLLYRRYWEEEKNYVFFVFLITGLKIIFSYSNESKKHGHGSKWLHMVEYNIMEIGPSVHNNVSHF